MQARSVHDHSCLTLTNVSVDAPRFLSVQEGRSSAEGVVSVYANTHVLATSAKIRTVAGATENVAIKQWNVLMLQLY